MGKEIISGEDFYATVVDMGEEIEFLTDPIIKQYASITAYRATGTTNMTDGAYQYRGVMTFDDVSQQNELLGEYFKRQTNKEPVHILASVIPENTTPKIAEVYALECNDKVDIISHYEEGEPDKYGDRPKIPVYIAKDVDCFVTVTQRQLTEQSPGLLVATVTNIILPAKYKLTYDNVVVKKSFVFDDETKENVYTDVKYQVESVDTSMMDMIEKEVEVEVEGEVDPENPDVEPPITTEIVKEQKFVGILRCTLTEDNR